MTSTSLPLEMADLAPPLASRLQNGLVVPLTPPGPAARQHLLCELAAKHRVVLPPELPRRLTERLRKAADFRPTALELNELIGALAQLDADGGTSSYLARADEFAERWVARPAVSLRTVSQAVAQYFGIKPMELKGPSRRQMVVRARASRSISVAVWPARALTDWANISGAETIPRPSMPFAKPKNCSVKIRRCAKRLMT